MQMVYYLLNNPLSQGCQVYRFYRILIHIVVIAILQEILMALLKENLF
nr:MAG TPA: protein of unknown function (DUF4884) [Caudoviricetes sp.]